VPNLPALAWICPRLPPDVAQMWLKLFSLKLRLLRSQHGSQRILFSAGCLWPSAKGGQELRALDFSPSRD